MIIYFDGGKSHLMRDFFCNSGVSFSTLYRNEYIEIMYKLLMERGLPKEIVYSRPVCTAEELLIVFDTKVTPDYLLWLRKRFPDQRIILWYWNSVSSPKNLRLIPGDVEIWSYSRQDCRRYGLHYNTPFYFDSAAKMAEEACNKESINRKRKTVPQVLFAGREKGRIEKILELGRLMEQNGAVCDFHFMQNGRWGKKRNLEKRVPYSKILDYVQKSDVLLDYYTDESAGLSLRAMESLFWRKKLVTNNSTIKEYDFYNAHNVYLLGNENRTLKEFFEEPLQEIPSTIRDQYLLSNWLRRFEEKER